jgi:hypothetical protein
MAVLARLRGGIKGSREKVSERIDFCKPPYRITTGYVNGISDRLGVKLTRKQLIGGLQHLDAFS